MTNKARTAPLDAAVAERLLDLLSTDDAFRERFCADPCGALQEILPEQPPHAVRAAGAAQHDKPAFCDCKIQTLASKQAIADARETLRSTLMQGLAYTSPNFETAAVGSRPAGS